MFRGIAIDKASQCANDDRAITYRKQCNREYALTAMYRVVLL